MTKLLARIPFSGFYNSIHDDNMDRALEGMFTDHETGTEIDYNLYEKALDVVKWGNVRKLYSEAYCGEFSDEFGLSLTFDSMESPRFYNYETDKIFAKIPFDSLNKLWDSINKRDFSEYVLERCSHRSGFISSYPANLADWPPLSEWDHNHIYYLLHFNMEQEFSDWELGSMENYGCNGHFDNWLCDDNPELNNLISKHYDHQTSES